MAPWTKKLLLFVLVFGAGLAVLLVVERATREPPRDAETGPGVEEAPPPPDLPGVRGAFTLSRFVEREGGLRTREWVISGAESRPLESGDIAAEGVALERFDVETGERISRLDAATAEVSTERGGRELGFELGSSVRLFQVEGSIGGGTPLAPATISATRLDGDLRSQRFNAPEEASIESRGASASGRGMVLDFAARSLDFAGPAEVRVAIGTGESVLLGSQGPLSIARVGLEEPPRRAIRARGGARLELPGPTPLVLSGDEIDVDVEVAAGEGAPRLLRLQARGAVRAEGGALVLRGDTAELELGPDGKPARLRLEGEPSGELPLGGAAGAGSATIAGLGPLVLGLGATPDLELAGPFDAAFGDATLRARGRLRAVLEPELIVLDVREGAVLASGGRELEAEELVLRVRTTPGAPPSISAEARGPANLHGPAGEASSFSLLTGYFLSLEGVGAEWKVPLALQVDLTVTGPFPLRLIADELSGADLTGPNLNARGQVSLQGAFGRGGGERLTIRGRDDAVLEGVAGRPAWFEREGLAATAARVRLAGSQVEASGAAVAEIRREDATWTVRGEHFSARVEEKPVDGAAGAERGETERRVSFHARDAVTAEGQQSGEEYQITCAGLEGTRIERLRGGVRVGARSELDARGVVEGRVQVGPDRWIVSADSLRASSPDSPGNEPSPDAELYAEGNVRFSRAAGAPLAGRCERLELHGDRRARLDPLVGGRVSLEGELEGAERRLYSLAANWIEYAPDGLTAEEPVIDLWAPEQAPTAEARLAPSVLRARAPQLRLDPTTGRLFLQGGAWVEGAGERGSPWTLSAREIELQAQEREGLAPTLGGVRASGGFALDLARGVRATGDELVATAGSSLLRMTGKPAAIEYATARFTADSLEFDRRFFALRAGPGTVSSTAMVGSDWQAIAFDSVDTLLDPDSAIWIFQSPRFLGTDREARATWAVVWLDRKELALAAENYASGERPVAGPQPAPAAAPAPPRVDVRSLFGQLDLGPLADLAREFYLEGPIEYFQQGQLLAEIGAFYLDLVDGHGWLADASVHHRQRLGGEPFEIHLHADWMRHSADGSLDARDATVTTCGYADPHVHVTAGRLRLVPTPDDPDSPWEAALSKPRINLYDTVVLPLPSVPPTALDKNFKPEFLKDLSLGTSGKFGPSVGTAFSVPFKRAGSKLNGFLGGDKRQFDAEAEVEVAYHGSRGGLLDGTFELSSPDKYFWRLALGLVPDNGEDKGLVRVDEDDRDTLRTWLRTRGRYYFDEREWIDAVASWQSDPGVQAEFWEDDFLRWEERETYAHWRKALDQTYFAATAKVRTDDFRSDTEELPSANAYFGRRELAALGPASLLWSGAASAAYLRRVEGEAGPTSPFDPPLLPEDEVLRADARQRLEAVVPVGAAGLRVTPFAELRGTAWDENVLEDDAPERLSIVGGARIATTWWKPLGQSGLVSFAPFAEFRSDMLVEESGGDPKVFDALDLPVEGEIFDAGFYTRWSMFARSTEFDLEVRQPHASGVAATAESGWLPTVVFANLSSDLGGVSLGITHDARYDPSPHETVFSATTVGFGTPGSWGVEAGHRRGLDELRNPLFEAATLAGRYRWTPKWEWEARQTFSLLENEDLATQVGLRRFGHDLVFEIELKIRAGEGTAIGISVRPAVGWDSSDLGLLDPYNL